jgi:putative SOS response-associated peptidase YedK
MCGRFCCAQDPDTIRTRLHKDNVVQDKDIEWVDQDKHRSSYNVCPTRWVPGLLEKDQEKTKCLQSMVKETFLKKNLPEIFIVFISNGGIYLLGLSCRH